MSSNDDFPGKPAPPSLGSMNPSAGSASLKSSDLLAKDSAPSDVAPAPLLGVSNDDIPGKRGRPSLDSKNPSAGSASLKSGDLLGKDSAPSGVAPAPLLGVSPSRHGTLESTMLWLQTWLSGRLGSDLLSANKSYPDSVHKLTSFRLSENHMEVMISSFGSWLARNPLDKIKGTGKLDPNTKLVYFKATKVALKKRFPDHPLLKNKDDTWWTDILARFNREAARASIENPEQYADAKSVPLYRDTTTTGISVDDHNMMRSPDAMYRAQCRGKFIVISQ